MENPILTIIFMAVVGALIGGFTNFIAIKMLFHPYNAIYIGSWKLPFTPGLIPKRRGELATQLGETVTKYLLTPEVFRKKLLSDDIRESVLKFTQTKVEEVIFTDEKTILDWTKFVGLNNLPNTIEGKVNVVIETQVFNVRNTLSSKSIEQILPEQLHETIERKIPELASYILEKGEEYFQSPKGEATIRNMMDDFLSSKGTIGGMLQMFFGDSNAVVGKLQRELVNMLKSPGTKNLLVNLFEQEWDKLKQQPIMNYLQEVEFESIIEKLQAYAKKELALEERLDKSINYYWPQGNEYVKMELLPKLLDQGFNLAEKKLEDVVNRLNLQEVVREQVDSFPLKKLEELVVSVTNRELKMITVLGAVLGGVIGIVQGLIVLLLN
ncbi:DUF445 domain-containing protein [Ureibacillus manganicus]|uniref:Membrane protein n=1 Tax=Ureibacillus manganicus DSM 26584 TaxID=1384049 RepID=A0A0A3I8Y1_9BACL|nr:DUF445 family protein [Ureibacillus manganicus]KGR79950.1 membrane protein [Ureibacillus manganicus DSM 26584]